MAIEEKSDRNSTSSTDEDVVMLAWGFIAWLMGSIYFVTFLWHTLSFPDFVLVWVACAFVVLASGLLDMVFSVRPRGGKKAITLWKGATVILMGFSLLGPIALVLWCILAAVALWKGLKKGVVHLASNRA